MLFHPLLSSCYREQGQMVDRKPDLDHCEYNHLGTLLAAAEAHTASCRYEVDCVGCVFAMPFGLSVCDLVCLAQASKRRNRRQRGCDHQQRQRRNIAG